MAKIAFVFPGQGSQSPGMLADLSEQHAEVQLTFEEASQTLGYNLWQLAQEGPAEKQNQTEFTQPLLLAASIACHRILLSQSVPSPEVVAGHSLGEYSALVAAGCLSFADGIRLVQKRGQFMQTAVPLGQGGMAAILGLEDDQVVAICASASTLTETVEAANFNAPGQVVIAGSNAALDRAIDACKEAGARRAMPLAVSAPFHSAMMVPAGEQMATELASVTISAPSIPVIQNVDAEYESDPDQIRKNLVRQMSGAVLWTSTVQKMAADQVTTLVEVGPGKVLSGLARRIDKGLGSCNVGTAGDLEAALVTLKSQDNQT